MVLNCSGKAIPERVVKTPFEITVNSQAVVRNTTLYFSTQTMKLQIKSIISEAF